MLPHIVNRAIRALQEDDYYSALMDAKQLANSQIAKSPPPRISGDVSAKYLKVHALESLRSENFWVAVAYIKALHELQ